MHANGTFWSTVILIGTTLTSAGLTAVLHGVRLPAILAGILGGVTPAAIIIVAAFIFEAPEPIGGFIFLLGFLFAGAVLTFGIPAAALAAILSAQLRGDPKETL